MAGLLGKLSLDGLQLIERLAFQLRPGGGALHLQDLFDEGAPLGFLLFIDSLLQRGVAGVLFDLVGGHAGGFGVGFQLAALLLQGGKQRFQFVQRHIGQGGAVGAGGAGVEHLDGLDGLIDLGLVLLFVHGLLQLRQRHFIHLGLRQPGLQPLGLQRLSGGLRLIDGGGELVPALVLADLLGGEVLLRPLLIGGQGALQAVAGDVQVLHIADGQVELPVLLLGEQLVAALQLAPLAGKQLGIAEQRDLFAVYRHLLLQDIQTLLAEDKLFAGGILVGFLGGEQHGEQLLPVLDQVQNLLRGEALGQLLSGQAAFRQRGALLRSGILFLDGAGHFAFGQPQGNVGLLLLFQLLGGLLFLLLLDIFIPLLGHDGVGVEGGGVDIHRFGLALPHRAGEDDQAGDELVGIGITEGVIAGGKGEQTVGRLDIHGGLDDGTLHDLFDVFIFSGVIVAVNEIVIIKIGVIGFADHDGKDFVHILAVDAVVADERVLLIITQLLVGLQVAEHGAVAHIVAVDDGIVGGLLLIDAEIDVGDAPIVGLEVDIGAVVLIVILRLHDGVIQLGIGDLDPAGDIGVAQVKRLKAGDVIFRIALHFKAGGGVGIVQAGQLLGELAVVDRLQLVVDDVDERR